MTLKINIIEECEKSKNKEFYYGALINKKIEDVYIGYGYLEPKERRDNFGPGKGHEEIILLLNGEMMMCFQDEDVMMKKGDSVHIPSGLKVEIENLTNNKLEFVVAGGHTVQHVH
ncbi:MAG: cupin domain-containing protein [Candidatus Lokiarchaeota archaeon]|nr:cupin domain-containing protein [Candidatus Lokiarchaeota archaeon]